MTNLKIRDFEIALRDVIVKSNLPIACVSSIIKNILFEIDELKEKQFINELLEEENSISSDIEQFERNGELILNNIEKEGVDNNEQL